MREGGGKVQACSQQGECAPLVPVSLKTLVSSFFPYLSHSPLQGFFIV